ncbi:non-specific lipid transfer protein GPI-anchored 12 [Capsicum galapagoense]
MAKSTKITTTIYTTFLLLSLFSPLIPSTKSQDSPPAPVAPAPSPGVNCFRVLYNMSDCLTFVERKSNLSIPGKGCCPEIAGLLDSNPICYCQMLGRAHSGAKIGFNIDVDKAVKLPSACNLEFPPSSTCSDLGIPVGAPLASEQSPAPSPGGFATSPTSDSKDNAASIIVFSKMQLLLGVAIMFFTSHF